MIFAIIPVIEIAILIKVGSYIGAANTIIIVIATAVIGALLVKMEGVNVMFQIRSKISQGVLPGAELIEGAMVLVAGALLVTPGFSTDLVGFLLVFPLTRKFIRKRIIRFIEKRYFSIWTIRRKS
ncbi:MAG TPA: FxsA family protein [Thermodesulfovibrionia bacterium]|nr:FxsA family protein [Thermodesulfovibrionia bacterium]